MAQEPITPASVAGAVDLSSLGQGGAPAATQPQQAQTGPNAPVATLPDAVIDGDERSLDEFAQLSQFLPVLVEMYAAWSHESQELSPVLAEIVRSAQGRMVMLRIDLDAHPSVGQQPQVLAIVGGRPVQLFTGNPPREQIIQTLNELIQLSAQQGMTGHVNISGEAADAAGEPAQPPLPPLHAEAQEALGRDDLDAATSAFERAIAENPADEVAKAGLAQTALLLRLRGKTLQDVRERAAAEPKDLDAQFDVADLDVSGGHIADAFQRLLALYPGADADGRTRIRERLLELFTVVGASDPRVAQARKQLTSLLFA